jgi:predicted DNA-binding protein with PD1-like motif
MKTTPDKYPRSRTLIHPGPTNPTRIQSRHSGHARHFRLRLAPGESLFDSLVLPLRALGVESASTTILGGIFERLKYCTAPPDPSMRAVVAYTSPIDSGRTCLIFGNATIGKGSNGDPLVHCHAAIQTESGDVKGGHILPKEAIVGAHPISVLVTALEGFELRVAFDHETNIPLIQPMDRMLSERSHG